MCTCIYKYEDPADIIMVYYLYLYNYNDCYYMPRNTSTNSLDGLAHAIQKVSERATAFWVEKSGTSTNGTPPYLYNIIYVSTS